MLGSINATGRVLHRSLMQLDAGCGHRRGCQCISATSDFYFYFLFMLTWLRFVSIQAESC